LRRLERHDELGHRRRVGGDGGCGEGALHVGGTVRDAKPSIRIYMLRA
jgi:hypothetical protein